MYRLFWGLIAIFLCLLALMYWFSDGNIAGGGQADLYALVPKDAVYIVETEQPIDKWQQFKNGNIWQHLQQNNYLAAVNAQVENIEQSLSGKEEWLKLIFKGKLLTSTHVEFGTYQLLHLLDLQQASRLTEIPGLLRTLLKSSGFDIDSESYRNTTVYRLKDPQKPNEVLHLTFKGRALAASYSAALLKKALDSAENPHFTSAKDFNEVKSQTNSNGLANCYINHSVLFNLIGCYANLSTTPLAALEDVLSVSALQLDVQNDHVSMQGQSLLNDSSASYLKALLQTGKGEMRAFNALPSNTSFFAAIGFDEFEQFRQALEQVQGKPKEPKPAENIGDLIAERVAEQVKKELPNWIDQEIALALAPRPDKPAEQAYIAVVPTGNKREHVAQMLAKTLYTLEQLNPFSIFRNESKREYQGYRIIRLPVEGMLQTVAGDFFKDMQQPYLVLMDEFLVFCDDETLLRNIIDQYAAQQTLASDKAFLAFFEHFNSHTSVFAYINMPAFYPVLMQKMKPEKQKIFAQNKDDLLRFPHWGLQMLPEGKLYQTQIHADFDDK